MAGASTWDTCPPPPRGLPRGSVCQEPGPFQATLWSKAHSDPAEDLGPCKGIQLPHLLVPSWGFWNQGAHGQVPRLSRWLKAWQAVAAPILEADWGPGGFAGVGLQAADGRRWASGHPSSKAEAGKGCQSTTLGNTYSGSQQGPSRTQGPGKSPFYLKPSSSALGLAPTPPQFLSGEVLKPGLVGSL